MKRKLLIYGSVLGIMMLNTSMGSAETYSAGNGLATGADSIAIGGNADASGILSIAIGNQTTTSQGHTEYVTTATGTYSVALGYYAVSTGYASNALGNHAAATADYANAIGTGSEAYAESATAVGTNAMAHGVESTAVGNWSEATAEDSVALGSYASATVVGGVAIGSDSVSATAAGATGYLAQDDSATWVSTSGAVSVGDIDSGLTRQITGVAAGTEDTDAVNVAQLKVVEQSIYDVESSVTNRINNLDGKVDKVGAGAAALASLHPLEYDKDDKLNFAAAAGSYHGQRAFAMGAFYRPDGNTLINFSASVGNGENMYGLGVAFALDGKNSSRNISKKDLMRTVQEVKAENADLRAEINELKSMIIALSKNN